jgi:hypothetical protein
MNTFLNKGVPSVVDAGLLETTWWRAMKKLVLSVLITLSGCSLWPRAYYRGQPVELNPLYEEICTSTSTIELPIVKERRSGELPIVKQRRSGENISSPPTPNSVSSVPTVSRQDGNALSNCRTKIRVNGKEQEVDSKEIVRRWL